MPRFFLSAYSVRVKASRENVHRTLGNFDRQGADLYQVFRDYLGRRRAITPDDNQANGKMLQVAKIVRNQRKHVLKGIIEAGEYGIVSRLYDTDRQQDSHHRQVVEAELLPYYFLIQLPAALNQGFLLLQRTGNSGILTLLSEDFRQEFRDNYPRLKLEINKIIPEQIVDEYLSQGRVTRVRYLRNSRHRDPADQYQSGGNYRQTIGEMELIHKVRRSQSVFLPGSFREFLGGQRSLTSLLELQDFECDNIKLEVVLNGNKRTIDLSHLDRIKSDYVLGDQVDIGPDGHPLFESIDSFATSLLADMSPEATLR